jgi:hypothetical protein
MAITAAAETTTAAFFMSFPFLQRNSLITIDEFVGCVSKGYPGRVPSEFNVDERPLVCGGMAVFSNRSRERGAGMEGRWRWNRPRINDECLAPAAGSERIGAAERSGLDDDFSLLMPAAPAVTPTVSAWADARFVDDGREGIPLTCCEL